MTDRTFRRNIVFLVLPQTQLLDLAGPAQAFYEADRIGELGLSIRFAARHPEMVSEQGLALSRLQPFEGILLIDRDFLVIPGIDFASFEKGVFADTIDHLRLWLEKQQQKGVNIATICSGALILAEAGLLDGYRCTSHWKCLEYMSEHYPRVHVLSDRLFVNDRNLYTSAGMSSGMDMSLAILEELYGPIIASKVAREMVIYLRRDRDSSQESVYLDYQTHFNPAIHKVQNYVISHPEQNPDLGTLSGIANMSERNLTRTFKEVTGRTITEFKHDVKLGLAKTFLNNPDYTIEIVARKCGFSDPRQLRRIWKAKMGGSISEYRDGLTSPQKGS